MISYDMHIHTQYCGHAEGMTVEAILDSALAKQLDTIAITDHIWGPESFADIDKIKSELARCSPGIKVIIGAEVDVDYRHTDGRFVIETCDLDRFDYVIAGFHYVPTIGNYAWNRDQLQISEEKLFEYWQSTLLGIVSNPKVTTLAHPGRMAGTLLDPGVWFEDVLSVLQTAAEISAKNNIAWELNELTGHRLTEYLQTQWHRVYEAALGADVKIIFGSDAHLPEHVGRCGFAETILEKLGRTILSTPKDLGY